MLTESILVGLVALGATFEWFLGTSLISRPIILGPIIGLLFGDLQTGIILGATLELVFLGSISIGAAIPPDVISGSILATAFAIKSGQGTEVALTLALPIATLMLVIKNALFVFVYPLWIRLADRYAENGDVKGVEFTHLAAGFFTGSVPMFLFVTISYYLGSGVMEQFLNTIPEFVKTGLQIATGMLPALGFAVLMTMILSKNVVSFYFLGFILSAYLKLPILAIAVIAGVIVHVIVSNPLRISMKGGNDDEF